MTREEAIEELERLLRHWDLIDEGIYDLSEHDKDAVEIALTALRPVSREQAEKVWRGEWELARRMAASIECKCPKCQRTVIFTGKPANFCEKCGSANTDEAVEMVMERMETLYEKT